MNFKYFSQKTNLERKLVSEAFKTENINGLFTVLKGTAQPLGLTTSQKRLITAIALRGRSKNRTGYLETTQMGRTNKVRLAVCSKAIVKQECLVFVFFSRLDDYNQTLLPGGE